MLRKIISIVVFCVTIISESYSQGNKGLPVSEFLERTSFPKDWKRIILAENDTIVPASCHGHNPEVNIYVNEAEYRIRIKFGVDDDDYRVRTVDILDSLTYRFNIRESDIFSLTFYDDTRTSGRWYYNHNVSNDYVFVPTKLIEHIPLDRSDCN